MRCCGGFGIYRGAYGWRILNSMNRFFYTAAILFFFTGCFTNNEWFVRWCIEINLSVVLSDEKVSPNAYILELNTGLVAFKKKGLIGRKY